MGRRRKLPVINNIKQTVDYTQYLTGFELEISKSLDIAIEEIDNDFYKILESTDSSEVKKLLDMIRPKTYEDCLEVGWGTKENPCPFVGCKNHLFLEINELGELKFPHKKKDFDEIDETCLNRAIENGPLDFQQITNLIGVVRERARQIKNEAKEKIKQTTEFRMMEGLMFKGDEEENCNEEECDTTESEVVITSGSFRKEEISTPIVPTINPMLKKEDIVERAIEKPKKDDKSKNAARPTKNEWRKRRFYPK